MTDDHITDDTNIEFLSVTHEVLRQDLMAEIKLEGPYEPPSKIAASIQYALDQGIIRAKHAKYLRRVWRLPAEL
jgi:hypothetical protein